MEEAASSGSDFQQLQQEIAGQTPTNCETNSTNPPILQQDDLKKSGEVDKITPTVSATYTEIDKLLLMHGLAPRRRKKRPKTVSVPKKKRKRPPPPDEKNDDDDGINERPATGAGEANAPCISEKRDDDGKMKLVMVEDLPVFVFEPEAARNNISEETNGEMPMDEPKFLSRNSHVFVFDYKTQKPPSFLVETNQLMAEFAEIAKEELSRGFGFLYQTLQSSFANVFDIRVLIAADEASPRWLEISRKICDLGTVVFLSLNPML